MSQIGDTFSIAGRRTSWGTALALMACFLLRTVDRGLGEKPVNHGLGDEANAAFRSPEAFGVEFRVFADDQPFRDFNIRVDDDVSHARRASDIDPW